ncbi:MAG: peptide chain release factor N(5)-glutamine methyltransferase [Siculibacillus sp.]
MSADPLDELEGASAPTVGAAVRALRRAFSASGEGALAEARTIVGHVAGLDLTGLVTGGDRGLDRDALERIVAAARRRRAGEPVQRVVGQAWFHGLVFRLSAETLIPRPDTETLVEAVIERMERGGFAADATIADLGVGSGAILVALLTARPGARGVGVDLSAEAAATAAANAAVNGVGERARFAVGSWFEPLGEAVFDVIVSNPPYIARVEIDGLDEEVRRHDPMLALDGGVDGLDAYRVLAVGTSARLRPGGMLALEIGRHQGAEVAALVRANGFVDVEVIADMAGRDRVVIGRLRREGE